MPDYAELGAEEYSVREKVQEKLQEWVEEDPKKAMEVLLAKVRSENDPELRSRLGGLLRFGFEIVPKGFIGITFQDIPLDDGRVAILVSDVRPDTAASRSGLKPGDLILKINGFGMNSDFVTDGLGVMAGFSTLVQSHHAGEVLKFEILRGAEVMQKKITLGELPPLSERQTLLNLGGAQWGFQQGFRELQSSPLEEIEKSEAEARFERWLKRNSVDETR